MLIRYAPKHVDVEDLVPVIEAVPGRTSEANTRVVEQDSDLNKTTHATQTKFQNRVRSSHITTHRITKTKIKIAAQRTSPQASYTLSRSLTTCSRTLTSVGMTSTFASPTIAATSEPVSRRPASFTSAIATLRPIL